MYLSELRLWNFRKYTSDSGEIYLNSPHLVVPFTNGLNVLIGENDSGKTAIIDAIKLITRTHSIDWIRVMESDFSFGQDCLRIEVIIADMSMDEASKFVDKLCYDSEGNPFLRIALQAVKNEGKVLPYDIVACTGDDRLLRAEEREYIKATYLKALRDADNELVAHRNSRTSQILLGHILFKDGASGKEVFEKIFAEANGKIANWFKDSAGGENSNKALIKDIIDGFLIDFIDNNTTSEIVISEADIKTILERISLGIESRRQLGLGTMNRLYMAAEMLHLTNPQSALHLCLVEELEAHLHPQAQMKVIKRIQKMNGAIQFVLTTHSPNLASKIRMDEDNTSVIMCKDNDVYPLTKGKTRLESKDYQFLDQFLDVTKSNLFFAKGIILVEGWAEEILIPAICEKLGYDLTSQEVSIVNVGSTAYLHFAKIFMRNDGKILNYPVAIVTDIDSRPNDDYDFDKDDETERINKIKANLSFDACSNVKPFIAPHWTLEWCLFQSAAFGGLFMNCCHEVHSHTPAFDPNSEGIWDRNLFRDKLAEKLKNRSLDKVMIASLMAKQIKLMDTPITIDKTDPANYIIDAIKHVCCKNDSTRINPSV